MLVADRKSTTSCFMSTGPAWHETMDRLAVKRWPSLREIRMLVQPFPWQPHGKCLQLTHRQLKAFAAMRTRSHKVSLLQSSCAQPQAKAIVHEHLQAVRSAVQKHIRMVRACLAKYLDHTRERRVYYGSHVQRLHGNPGGIDADHFMSSRNSRAHSCAADAGHSMLTLRPLRHSSTRIGRSAPSVGS